MDVYAIVSKLDAIQVDRPLPTNVGHQCENCLGFIFQHKLTASHSTVCTCSKIPQWHITTTLDLSLELRSIGVHFWISRSSDITQYNFFFTAICQDVRFFPDIFTIWKQDRRITGFCHCHFPTKSIRRI